MQKTKIQTKSLWFNYKKEIIDINGAACQKPVPNPEPNPELPKPGDPNGLGYILYPPGL